MANAIDFYFDFSSPYAYISSFRIDELAGRFGRRVTWRPYMMGAALKLTQRPISMDSPVASDYLRHDCERNARLDHRPFVWPTTFPVNGIHAARLYYHLFDEDELRAKAFASDIFQACFAHGQDIGNVDCVLEVAKRHALPTDHAQLLLRDAAVKQRLKRATDDALQVGVFGSPFFVVDGEAFWGNDRLWQVKRWLDWGGW